MDSSNTHLKQALKAARETHCLELGNGVVQNAARVFSSQFGAKPGVIVADAGTFEVAGKIVGDVFQAAGQPLLEPFLFTAPDLYAEDRFVVELETALKKHTAIPIALGSGTINDLTKLAAHRSGRPYMAVATAASMDGYTAFGASITVHGSKQTMFCPAPTAVVADLDFICAAPGEMNSWGYADLLAKVTAGADWILADALGVEPIDREAWNIVQSNLRELVADPASVRARNPAAIGRLTEGLMLGGFAMQMSKSSRVASGAEHQFSHLWDMQHHQHNGRAPSHGFKVGIGTLAITALYEQLLKLPLDQIDVERCCRNWPGLSDWQDKARELFGESEVTPVALQEISQKAGDAEILRGQLLRLQSVWPQLRDKLREQLLPFTQLRGMLLAAGAPVEPEQIGISRERLRLSFWQAFFVRRRFTVLDLAVRTGLLDGCVDEIFGPNGSWPVNLQPRP